MNSTALVFSCILASALSAASASNFATRGAASKPSIEALINDSEVYDFEPRALIEPNLECADYVDFKSEPDPPRKPRNANRARLDLVESFLATLPTLKFEHKNSASPPNEPSQKKARTRNRRVLFYRPEYESLDFFDHRRFLDFVNSSVADPSDTESDEENVRDPPLVVIRATYGDDKTVFYAGTTSLYPVKFEALSREYSEENAEAILTLFRKKKYIFLSTENKKNFLHYMVNFLSQERCPPIYLDILKKCFECGFDKDADCHVLRSIFENQKALEIALQHDREIIKEKFGIEGLRLLIEDGEYKQAEIAIRLGANPKDTDAFDGRNALDHALISNEHCQKFLLGRANHLYRSAEVYQIYCLEIERERFEFIDKLVGMGVEESLTVKNLYRICNEERFEYAKTILNKMDFGALSEYLRNDDKISPLSIAIRTEQEDLIGMAADKYLDRLSIKQLYFAKSLATDRKSKLAWLVSRVEDRIQSIKDSFVGRYSSMW